MKAFPLAAVATIALATQMTHASAALATTQTDERAMTKMASQLLSDADLARKDLAAKNATGATQNVDSAMGLRDKLASTAHADGLSMVVPIFAELDDTSVLADAVKRNAKTTGKTPKTVLDSQGAVTTVAIDLDKAKARLASAKSSIASKNFPAAETTLGRVSGDLIETDIITDRPLLTAREDLARAQTELRAKNSPAATTDLREAARSLQEYRIGRHIRDARLLSAEILAADRTHDASVGTKIAAWWSSVQAWFTKTV